MLYNATLLRIDPPPPGGPGPALSIRCAVVSPSAEQAAVIAGMNWAATRVLLLPMGRVAAAGGAPVVDQRAVFQPDGCPTATYRIAHVADRVGPGLSHLELFLAPL
jgi:hypothetical protein